MSSSESGRPEIAMVSRIRVEVRGESMKSAEAVAFMALDHARLAGVFEGYVPTNGEYSDHFFNRPEVTRKWGESLEPWGELGMPYYGRLSFVFEPQAVYGGLRQFGYRVEREDDGPPVPDGGGHGVVVLERQVPVTREHMWEASPLRDHADETGESILADIRTIRDVKYATAMIERDGVVGVQVKMDGWEDVAVQGESLREAAAKARSEVLDMIDPISSATHKRSTEMPLDDLTEDVLARMLAHQPYKTIIVGSNKASMTAHRILSSPDSSLYMALTIHDDKKQAADTFVLTTEDLPHTAPSL